MVEKIGLALGGGVVRGLAHVGVLSVLEEAELPVDCIAGTSAGAIVGACYAAGMPVADIEKLAFELNWRRLAQPVWPRQGFVSFDRLERWLTMLLGDVTFADLPRALAIVAADLERGEVVVVKEGPVARAVQASCSLPGLVTPVRINGCLLSDGGVVDDLPVAATRSLGADFVIGVDLCQPARRRLGPLGLGLMALETLIQRAGGGVNAADYLIRPELAGATYFRFSHRRRLIDQGWMAARQALPELQARLGQRTSPE